ncbi:MAG: hypothetical protein KAW47_08910 [Thermoplasmatales archaeon]|nr:hypothetical protein [Thermoplasmatales archaeon]
MIVFKEFVVAIVLSVFMVITLPSQMLWLTFVPISCEISKLFGVSAFDQLKLI